MSLFAIPWISSLPQDQTFWYLKRDQSGRLEHDIATEVIIIGGGMAGLSAAQSFKARGLKVVVIEQNYCGSGASGKSSGFITPDAEISFHEFIKKYGMDEAKRLWSLVISGVDLIRGNILTYQIDCDYQKQDTLIVANTQSAFKKDLTPEHQARLVAGYPSMIYNRTDVEAVIGSPYKGAITYGDTFGIQGYHYCQGMKKVLQDEGVLIYEETPAIAIDHHGVQTPHATIKAEHIIICTDRFSRGLVSIQDQVYHAQTNLLLSAPLSDQEIHKIFPVDRYMVWDTDTIYQYYRITGDNRLMVGGSNIWTAFSATEKHGNSNLIKKLHNYIQKKFPRLSVQFEYSWPGMIGISKDIVPIAGFDAHLPSVYYIAAAAGLPWAAALGAHSCDHVLNKHSEFEKYFSPYRSYPVGRIVQKVIGDKLTFMLSNMLTVASI
jgi:gamma-glutamylputrescine oxidase